MLNINQLLVQRYSCYVPGTSAALLNYHSAEITVTGRKTTNAIRSITHISSLQTIIDNNNDFVAPDKMIAELLSDNQQIARNQRAAIKTTEDSDDSPTSNILQELLDATERRIWFLFEVSRGGSNEL